MTDFVIPPSEVLWTHNGKELEQSRYSRLSQRMDWNNSREVKLSRLSSKLNVEKGGDYICQIGGVSDNVRVELIRSEDEHQLPITNKDTSVRDWTSQVIVIIIFLYIEA